ncbi:MAG: caspase family protein, partial [Mucilaginibacter sp.]
AHLSFSQEPKLVLPTGHTSPFVSLHLSPDGKFIIAAARDNKAKVFETSSSKLIFTLDAASHGLYEAIYSPSGKYIATFGEDSLIKVWDSKNGVLLQTFEGLSHEINFATFTPDESSVLTSSKISGQAVLRDVGTGGQIGVYKAFENNIVKAIFTSQGDQIIICGHDNRTIIFNTKTGDTIHTLTDTQSTADLFLSTTNQTVVTSSDDNTVKTWNLKTGKLRKTFSDYKSKVVKVCLSSNNEYLATISSEGTIRIRDPKSNRNFLNLRAWRYSLGGALSFSHNNQYLVCCCNDTSYVISLENFNFRKVVGSLTTFDINDDIIYGIHATNIIKYDCNTGKILQTENGNDIQPISWGKFILNNRYIATCDKSTLKIFNYYQGELEKVWQLKNSDCVLNADGSLLLTRESDSALLVRESLLGKVIQIIKGHFENLYFARFSQNNQALYIPRTNGDIDLYSLLDGKLFRTLPSDTLVISKVFSQTRGLQLILGKDPKVMDSIGNVLFQINNSRVQAVSGVFSKHDELVIITMADSTTSVWDIEQKKLLSVLKDKISDPFESDYFQKKKGIVFIRDKRGLHFLFINTGICFYHMDNQGDQYLLKHIDISKDGKYLLTWGSNCLSEVWTNNGKLLYDFKGQMTDKAGFSDDSKYIFTYSYGGSVRIWNVQSGEPLHTLSRSYSIVRTIGFSKTGKYLFVSNGENMDVWDTAKWECRTLNGHTDDVNAGSFSKEDDFIVTTSYDNSAKIWDTKSWSLKGTLTGHNSYVNSIDIQDGLVLTTASDGFVKLWDLYKTSLIYTLSYIDTTNYLISDNFGRYDGTELARKQLYYVCGTEIINLDQLRDLTWESGLAAKLTGADKDAIHARKIALSEICGVTPLVERVPSSDSDYHYLITPRSGGLGQIFLWVNGQKIKSYNPEDLIKRRDHLELIINQREIGDRLYSDRPNTIDIRAYAESVHLISRGDPSIVGPAHAETGPAAHHLFCIAIGITDYKGPALNTLHYASQDAADISQTITLAAKRLLDTGQKEEMVTSYLLNTDIQDKNESGRLLPYRDNIRRKFYEVALKATPDDIVIIFMSGHGVLQDHQFYYLTKDASAFSLDGVENRDGIGTDTLMKWLVDIKANTKILILDACNSGQAVESLTIKKSIPYDQRQALENLNTNTGTFILAASASGHSAFEMSEYGQGILAYNLLLGIQTGAGLRDDKFIDVSTWFQFASKKVEQMAKDNGERQTPQSWGAGTAKGIDIGMADINVKKNIILSHKKPIVTMATVLNTDITRDNLDVQNVIEGELTKLNFQGGKSSKLVFISNAKGSEIFQINCQYHQVGEIVIGTVVLYHGDDLLQTIALKSSKNQLQENLRKLVDKITDDLDN